MLGQHKIIRNLVHAWPIGEFDQEFFACLANQQVKVVREF
jgi:hypothetical protein